MRCIQNRTRAESFSYYIIKKPLVFFIQVRCFGADLDAPVNKTAAHLSPRSAAAKVGLLTDIYCIAHPA